MLNIGHIGLAIIWRCLIMNHKKTAIITGAASGIGLGLANYFATAGYNLFLIDIKEIPAIEQNVEIKYIRQDITDFTKTEQCIMDILDEVESIDVLVNDAGLLIPGFIDAKIEDAQKLVHNNLLSHFNITKSIANVMKKQKSGYIFNISSRSGLDARPELGIYSISKFGLMAFNEALYEEMAKTGVKVTALCPSVVDTPMGKTSDLKQSEMIPVEDIVATVDYLLKLNSNTYIRELYIDCKKSLIRRLS